LKSVQKKFKYSLTRDIGFVILRSHTETNISHMRTKTLLLTAALTAAGLATSMAQVYSVNMVGYINQSIPAGYSMLANHLNNTPNNLVTTLFPTPPDGTTVYKFDPASGGYEIAQYIDPASGGTGWEGVTTMTLGPGEGCFFQSPSAFTHTFVGEVQLASTLNVNAGYQIVSSVLPQSLPLQGAANDGVPAAPVGLGYTPGDGDTVYRYDAGSGGYLIDQYIDPASGGTGWEGASAGAPPTPQIGEAFWISHAGAANPWSRNFVVGVD
jgi:hypothetical protein